MAKNDNEAEKVEVRVDRKTPTEPSRPDQKATTEFDGGFAQDMHSTNSVENQDVTTPEAVADSMSSENEAYVRQSDSDEQATASTEETEPMFDNALPEEGGSQTEQGESESYENQDSAPSDSNAARPTSGKGLDEGSESTEDSHVSESAEERAAFEDFYSSKLDTSQFDNTQSSSKPTYQAPASSSPPPVSVQGSSLRVWFLLIIFLVTSFAGLVTLYQLEQEEPGAGMIFDWLEEGI